MNETIEVDEQIEPEVETWIGKVVQLKSGGPSMTVTNMEDDMLSCTWFVCEMPQHGNFRPWALRVVAEGHGNK